MTLPFPLILGSSSVYRKALLSQLKIPFTCVSPDIDETAKPSETLHDYVKRLAYEKAQAVAKIHPNALIIGADQAAFLPGLGFISKPETHENAVHMLKKLSGQRVTFLNGLCLWHPALKRAFEATVGTVVTLRHLSETEILNYLEREDALNCGGGLRSEGLGIALCASIENNDPTALIGLPLITLCGLLEKAGINVLEI